VIIIICIHSFMHPPNSSSSRLIFVCSLSGNAWKPDSEKMGSTDVGDYFPDDYEAGVGFEEGMGGSSMSGSGEKGPAMPGMENLGEGAFVTGGIDLASEIPAGMEFVASSVPDGEFIFNQVSSTAVAEMAIDVKPICMGFEDYYAAFAPGSHPSFSVSPVAGRMDRRGGEPSKMVIRCDPQGASGTLEGDLVVNLPEDNSKICYKIKASAF
jgi:hypothetical protein